MAPVKSKKAPKNVKKYVIDASATEQNIVDISALEKYLVDNIKVDGKRGNLAGVVEIKKSANKIELIAQDNALSGKAVKYYTKKFLHKNQLRDWLRVVSASRGVLELRFFNLVASDDENEEEDEDEE